MFVIILNAWLFYKMCTPITQIITCNTVRPKCPICDLNPQIWTNAGEYSKYIYNTCNPITF